MERTRPQDGKSNKERLHELLTHYLGSEPYYNQGGRKIHEVEVRFGTRASTGIGAITRIHYNNVIEKLYSVGFRCDNTAGINYLRATSEFLDPKTGNTRLSNIRAEMVGLDLIQKYCKTDSLRKLLEMPAVTSEKLKFTQKRAVIGGSGGGAAADGSPINDIIFPDYNYSISYKIEQDFGTSSNVGSEIIRNWEQNKKIFRYINRVKFIHEKYPIAVDLSIVKSSKYDIKKKLLIPELTIADSAVFQNPEKYEIELELMNERITNTTTVEEIQEALRACIRIVLGGIQQTNYPISYPVRQRVLEEYMAVRGGGGGDAAAAPIRSKHFIGPNSVTLMVENVMEAAADSIVPNIRKNYVVTDKADGERRLLFIDSAGAIYMIDTNMNVIFTGAHTKTAGIANSILDGEYIIHDKHHQFINLYAAFDVYFVNGRDVRALPFIKPDGDVVADMMGGDATAVQLLEGPNAAMGATIIDPTTGGGGDGGGGGESGGAPKKKAAAAPAPPAVEELPSRLHVLTRVINNIYARKSKDAPEPGGCEIHFECKNFYGKDDIFREGCDYILANVEKNLYRYNTDGLIFTPAYLGVGVEPNNPRKKTPPNDRSTWEYSFKWKPPQFNTIDFLVSTKKQKNTTADEIHYMYKDGQNNTTGESIDIEQYKTLILRCGFNKNEHRYVNPWFSVIQGDVPSPDVDNENEYKPAPFIPSNPFDENACFCNITLQHGPDKKMLSEEGELIEDEMIVEFRYDLTRDAGWRWVPLRVRYDKTSEYRNGGRNYGNAYHVANTNWKSIHYPITAEIIRTGENITEFSNDGVYYNNKDKTKLTQGLRDFHNLFIKRKLIESVSSPGNTLIDYAVGKGGDIPKWVENKLAFVFGIDISRDNIQNQLNGVCARYLQECKKRRRIFRGMFVNGNSGLNLRSGEALVTEQDKKIARAVFGEGPKDRELLGAGVYGVYGHGAAGFHISSCQFALHYFFQSEATLHKFLRNVSECTRVGGYFIGACFDGSRVFELLRNRAEGESFSIYSATETDAVGEKKMIFEIMKKYSYTGFSNEYTSVGYPISVYQESINQHIVEYLVHFDYLIKLMEDYGFMLDRGNQNITGGLESFDRLFHKMTEEARKDKGKGATYYTALKMTEEEKQISFLNRAFVFKKIHEVDAAKVYRVLMRGREEGREDIEVEEEPSRHAVAAAAPKKMRIAKSRKRVVLDEKNYSPINDIAPAAAAAAPPKPIVAAAAAAPEEGPKKRCPKGTRRNKAGDCVSTTAAAAAAPAPEPVPVPEPKAAPAPVPAPAPEPEAAAAPKKRCPKGTRRNKAGECVPTGK